MTSVTMLRLLAVPFVAASIINASPVKAQSSRPVMQSGESYAQPADHDKLAEIAVAINARRSDFFAKGDAAGVASLYSPDATYVEIMPRLEMMSGHANIESHFRDLFKAHATELRSTVVSAQRVDNDTQIVGGDYFIVAKNKKTMGHFVQILRREPGGAWKIVSHVFARPEPITFQETADYRG
jgi:uncharacterized protein (TIGR02246 family)